MGKHSAGSGDDRILDDGRTEEVVEGDETTGPTTDGREGVLDQGETADIVEAGNGEPTKAP